jgi:hypothetical protein
MGYTHYFYHRTIEENAWNKITEGTKKLIEAIEEGNYPKHKYWPESVPLKICSLKYDEATGEELEVEPIVDEDQIWFNGATVEDAEGNTVDTSFETFVLPRVVSDERIREDRCEPIMDKAFDFCKTARRPYDLIVCSVLLLVEHYAPEDVLVKSDGDYNDWAEARQYVKQVLDMDLNIKSLRD